MEHAAFAVRKCPFLAQLAKKHGEEFATAIAIAPTKPVGSEPLPTGTDAVCGLAESFRLFHGPQGVVPLNKGSKSASTFDGSRAGCPFHAGTKKAPASAASESPARAAPFATISLSNFGKGPNFGDFLRKQLNKGKGQRPHSNQQRPQRPSGTHSSNAGQPPRGPASTSTGNASSGGTLSGSSNFKPQRPLGDPSGPNSSGLGRGLNSSHSKPPGAAGSSYSGGSSSSSTLSSHGGGTGPLNWATTSSSSSSAPSPFQQQRLGTNNNSSSSSSGSRGHSGSGADSTGGRGVKGSSGGTLSNSSGSGTPSGCPLRKWLGPAAGLVFNQYDKLVCPPAIIAARAALSKTAAVQQLRPQALPVKLVAVAAVVAGVNMPCGAVREHFEKFSLGWFVAIHATIPFVAMLRKAVIMPKYAIVVTIAAAVLGQVVGSRLERMRLRYEEQHGPLLSLQLPLQPASLLDSLQPAAVADISGSGRRPSTASGSQHMADGSSKGRSSDSLGDQHWRARLASEPAPAVDSLASVRCGGPMPGGLFARLPLVKA